MNQPKEYVAKRVSSDPSTSTTLEDATTKLCNEMLEKDFTYVGTVASIQQMSATLLFAKF